MVCGSLENLAADEPVILLRPQILPRQGMSLKVFDAYHSTSIAEAMANNEIRTGVRCSSVLAGIAW